MDLEGCLYIPNYARNILSIRKLDALGFYTKFGCSSFSLYRHEYFYEFDTLMDSLYRFNLDIKFFESQFHVENHAGIKCTAPNESPALLWFQR